MTTYTENYNLTLPEERDNYNVENFNENFETIDALMAENESTLQNINAKVGSPAESGNTLFSMLENNHGSSVIRSIQYKTTEYISSTGSVDIPINTVDLAKTIVILERLYDQSQYINKVVYTLTENNLHVVPPAHTGILGFWIIEFN